MGKASTPIKDLPETEISDKVIDDIRDIISESGESCESVAYNVTDSPDYYKDTINKFMVLGKDPIIVFFLFMVLQNQSVSGSVLNLPYIKNYSDGIYGNVILALLASVIFFLIKYFDK